MRICNVMWASANCPQSHTASGKNKDLVKELEAYEVSVGMDTARAIAMLPPLCVGV